MPRSFSFFILLLFSITFTNGQQIIKDFNEMEFYADVMVNATEGAHRDFAASKFYNLINQELAEANSFDTQYKSLRWVSIQYPQDSTFRLFSWQVKHSETDYEYINILQKQDGSTIQCMDNADPDKDYEYAELSQDDWYGLLVTDIKKVDEGEESYYLLFGTHQLDQNIKTKVVETLSFEEDGVGFGKNVFLTNPGDPRPRYKNRLLLRYTATASVNLNYNPGLNAIVYDNIISHIGGGEMGEVIIPDGSYKAYAAKNGKWEYVDKVYDLIVDEPPMEHAKKKENRDLFGRSKNK